MPFLKNMIKKFDKFQCLELCDIYQTFYHNVLFVIYMIMNISILRIFTKHLCNYVHFYPSDIHFVGRGRKFWKSMLANRWCHRLICHCDIAELNSVIAKLSHFQIMLMLVYQFVSQLWVLPDRSMLCQYTYDSHKSNHRWPLLLRKLTSD